MELNRLQPTSQKREGAAIFYSSKLLRGLGFGLLWMMAASAKLTAQELPSPETGGNAQPIQVNSPSGSNPSDSQSNDNSPGNDNSKNNDDSNNNSDGNNKGNPNGSSLTTPAPQTPLDPTGSPNAPLVPQTTTSPFAPLSAYAQGQTTQASTPVLYNTGAYNLSQIATNNALQQTYEFGAGSGFSSDQGMSYSHPLIDRILLGPFDLRASLTTAVVSDDNLTAGQLNGSNKLSDTSIAFTPSVGLIYGNHDGERAFASVVYAPTITRYFQHTGEDSVNQNVGFNATYPFQRLTLNLSETFTQITGINQDINARTTQTASVTQLGAGYSLTDKLGLSSQLQELITSYDNGGGFGDEISSFKNTLAYQASDKLTIGPAINLGVEQPQGGRQQTFEQGLVSATYLATDKITLSGNGGAEIRQANADVGATGGSRGSTISPVFNVGIGYAPFDSTKLGLYGYQSLEASSGSTDQTVTNTGVGFAVSQRFLRRFYLGFQFSYSHADYKASSNGGGIPATGTANNNFLTTTQPNGSTQDNFVYRPSLSFSPTLWSSVGLYYQYQDNESSAPGVGYHDNQSGVSVSAQF